MIWQSIPVMTFIDLCIIGLFLYAFWAFYRSIKLLKQMELLAGVSLVMSSLCLVALFHLADLTSMFILPIFMPKNEAMGVMRYIHLNLHWAVALLIVTGLAAGLVYSVRSLYPKLYEYHEEMKSSQKMLKMVLDTVPVRVFWKDFDSKYLGCNIPFARDAGLNIPGELIGKDDFQMSWKNEADLYRSDDRRVMDSGESKLNFEEPQSRPDGTKLWLKTSKIPLRDTDGKVFGVLGTYEDITKRKRIEEELRTLNEELELKVVERTRGLEIVNRELEAFSYSISHDLRAPLRAIDGFSQAIVDDYIDKLDEQGKDFLLRIHGNAVRMGQLIDDLLKLSRLTRSEIHREEVDLSALAEKIAVELRETEPDRLVEFTVMPNLTATADPHLLRVVLENLLGNAWKFTGKRDRAKIEFGSTIFKREPAFYIRDDGAGFDKAYADKLFTPFQRLHSTEEFPGSGIGLATVQRIIHRHGGRLWAEGAVDKGAIFYFTLKP